MLQAGGIKCIYVLARTYMLKRLREVCGKKMLTIFDLEDIESVIGLWYWSKEIEDQRMLEAAGWYLSLNFAANQIRQAAAEFGMDDVMLAALAQSAHIEM